MAASVSGEEGESKALPSPAFAGAPGSRARPCVDTCSMQTPATPLQPVEPLCAGFLKG